jgi:hypothetical protein
MMQFEAQRFGVLPSIAKSHTRGILASAAQCGFKKSHKPNCFTVRRAVKHSYAMLGLARLYKSIDLNVESQTLKNI